MVEAETNFSFLFFNLIQCGDPHNSPTFISRTLLIVSIKFPMVGDLLRSPTLDVVIIPCVKVSCSKDYTCMVQNLYEGPFYICCNNATIA